VLACIDETHVLSSRRRKLAKQLICERWRNRQNSIEIDHNVFPGLDLPKRILPDFLREVATSEHLAMFVS
jgi:hypothetical protein